MLDDKQIEALKLEHGPIHLIETAGRKFVAKPMSRAEWKRFKAARDDDRKKQDAAENLVRACLVYPPADAHDVLFDELPALSETLAGDLLELGGLAKNSEKKAL